MTGRKGRTIRRTRVASTRRGVRNIDRILFVKSAFACVAAVLVFRLFWVQIITHQEYVAKASDQHEWSQELQPARGEMYAKDEFSEDGLSLVAGNHTVYQVYLNPLQSKEYANDVTDILVQTLQVDRDTILARASKEKDAYEPVKHAVTDPEINALKKLIDEKKVKGIHWVTEESRWYPEPEITSAITGFVGIVEDKKKGQYGLEGFFNEELSGVAGSVDAEIDQAGRYIATADKDVVDAHDGDMLVLTIDRNIQYKACTTLANAVEKHQAIQGSLIIMNPKTGAILAMCNAPVYDANNYSKVEDISFFTNDAISTVYEPGSVMKAMSIAAAVNEGVVTPYSTYEDVGTIKIQGHSISNYSRRSYGVQNMTTVLQESLNLGTVFAVQKIGNEKWLRYLQEFGFGTKTGITLAGESAGNISQVKLLQDVYTATSSFGQGMTATPMQMIQAYAALANGGSMMKPYIVDQRVDTSGSQYITEPEEISHPVTPETARTLAAMLVTVVDEGHSKGARIPGYSIAGKTGTAQIAVNGTYDANRHIDTFIGFGPVSDAQFVILVKIDEPKDVPTAEFSAVPVAGEVEKFLVNYLKIEPDRVGN